MHILIVNESVFTGLLKLLIVIENLVLLKLVGQPKES